MYLCGYTYSDAVFNKTFEQKILLEKLNMLATLFAMCGNGWMEDGAFVIISKRPYCSIACCAALGRANVS